MAEVDTTSYRMTPPPSGLDVLQKVQATVQQKQAIDKSKLDLITELLIVGNSTQESFSLFEKAKANFAFEMDKRKSQMEKDISLIRSIAPARDYSHCDKPLSEIETNFEIIKPD